MEKPAEDTNIIYKNKSHGQYRELLYSYDEKGNFEQNVKFHDEPERVVLEQAWDFFNERAEEAKQKVKAGKVSPIVYYMEKILADPLGLSMMAGISLWKVKMHFRPYFFNRLSEKTLAKYAEAFNISVEQLKSME